jgi:tRNA 2-thiouridine synthesizing protein A
MSHPKSNHVIDARYLEPPEPFVLTMEALDTLPDGEKLLLLLFREPHPLYRILKQNGYTHQTELVADGTFEILIWRP